MNEIIDNVMQTIRENKTLISFFLVVISVMLIAIGTYLGSGNFIIGLSLVLTGTMFLMFLNVYAGRTKKEKNKK